MSNFVVFINFDIFNSTEGPKPPQNKNKIFFVQYNLNVVGLVK